MRLSDDAIGIMAAILWAGDKLRGVESESPLSYYAEDALNLAAWVVDTVAAFDAEQEDSLYDAEDYSSDEKDEGGPDDDEEGVDCG